MNPPIGFVLVTHNNPEQILFLCEQLTARFDRPPIVIHHDFHQTPLNTAIFPANVTFVPDWLQTNWGGFAVVDGQLRALRILYKNNNPDWFVVLSGADYPINSADFILHDLYSHDYHAYLDHRRIQYCRLSIPPGGWGNENFIHPSWVTLAFERYMAIGFGFYKLATRLKWKKKAIYLRSDFFIRRFTPFDGSLSCYAGDHWLTGSRAAANALLDDNETNRKLIAHYRKRPNPDEAFHHTVLCNNPSLRVSPDNKRFADWEGCTNHPLTLTESDFGRLLTSSDHFGRKFAFDPEALLTFNRMVDAKG